MIFGFKKRNLILGMKIKSLLAIFSILTSLIFVISCDDDLNTIGSSIQPPSDTISVATDTITVSARTVSLSDAIYARTTEGVLGKYEDNLFGTIKSDYLCQFYFPSDAKFSETFKHVDSTRLLITFREFSGDSLAPTGLSAYKVTTPLTENYYTNIDPAKYSDMKQTLTSTTYTISGVPSYTPSSGQKYREIRSHLGAEFGQKIYDGWKNKTITDNKSFNEYFPGMYITTNFGSGNLIKVIDTSIEIAYTKTFKDTLGNVKDTTGTFMFSVTPEVIQLNHIKNSNPEELFKEGTGASYLKTPAGVCSEITFPIGQIVRNMEKKNKTSLASAQFSLKGYTEKESDPLYGGMSRPRYVLLVHKDSVDSYFTKRTWQTENNKTSFIASRNTSSNIYSFGNISALITAYKDKDIENATFLLIPVNVNYSVDANTNRTIIVGVFHYMFPSTAILRTDPENLKLDLVYNKF